MDPHPPNFPDHPARRPIVIPGLGTSPKTSLVGYLLGGSALLGVAGQIIQSFPEGGGVMDLIMLIQSHWVTIGPALAAMGIGYFARDNGGSSKNAGAK